MSIYLYHQITNYFISKANKRSNKHLYIPKNNRKMQKASHDPSYIWDLTETNRDKKLQMSNWKQWENRVNVQGRRKIIERIPFVC